MKRFSYILLFSLIACSYSTPFSKTKPVFTLNDFRKTVELNGKEIALHGIERPSRLIIIPEKNVFMFYEGDYRSEKKWLHIYSLDSVKLIRTLINNGEADGELLGAFQMQYDKRNGGEIYILDAIKQQLIVYKADSLIAGVEKPFKIIGNPFHGYHGIPINGNMLMRSVIINDLYNIIDVRVSESNQSKMLLNKYGSDLSLQDSFGFYPKTTDDNISPQMLSSVLSGCLSITDNNKYLVFSGITTDYLAVYDTSGKMIGSAIGPGELDVNYKVEKAGSGERIIPLSDHYAYASRTKMNKGLLYALYNGKSRKNRVENSSDLLLFTRQLHPEIRYKLNLPIFDFDIDWQTKTLYGLRRDGATNQLVIYQL